MHQCAHCDEDAVVLLNLNGEVEALCPIHYKRPNNMHLIEVSQKDIAEAWRVVNRLAHRLGREDVDITFAEAYASEVTGTYLHHQGGTRRIMFQLAMCDCDPDDGKGYHRPTCPGPYPIVHTIRVWEATNGQWKLADNTLRKVGLKK